MFILLKDRPQNTAEEFEIAWKKYADYLDSILLSLPRSTRDFAVAEWHYNFSDHRCPHDGWLEALAIEERKAPADVSDRSTTISMKLLGAYHDGHILLDYMKVISYRFGCQDTGADVTVANGHGDWLYDEVRISESGNVIHEIEWSSGATWLIECGDISYTWRSLQ